MKPTRTNSQRSKKTLGSLLLTTLIFLTGCSPVTAISEEESSSQASEMTNSATEPGSTNDPSTQSEQIVGDSALSNQPWEWDGYTKFPTLYLAAEPEGAYSEEQLEKINRFSLAIIEFRAGQFAYEEESGRWADGDLQGFMEARAQQIKNFGDGSIPVLTYTNAKWASTMFSEHLELLSDESLFLPDSRMCSGFLDYPLDIRETDAKSGYSLCRWDFRNSETQNIFSELLVNSSKHPSTSGIFIDNGHSVSCDAEKAYSNMTPADRASFFEGQNQAYRQAFLQLEEQGQYPILSSTIGYEEYGSLVPWEDACPEDQEAVTEALEGTAYARNNEFWMWNLGETASRQILNTIREAEDGIPTIVHMPYFPEDGGCLEGCLAINGEQVRFSEEEFVEFGIAAFLIGITPGSYFGFSDMQSDTEGGGWFDESWKYYSIYDELVTGEPVSEPVVSDDGMEFSRDFENGSVFIDVGTGTYELDFDF